MQVSQVTLATRKNNYTLSVQLTYSGLFLSNHPVCVFLLNLRRNENTGSLTRKYYPWKLRVHSIATCSVYLRSLVEVYVHRLCAANANRNSNDWGQIDKCLLLVTLLKIPTKDFNTFLKLPFFGSHGHNFFSQKQLNFPSARIKTFYPNPFRNQSFLIQKQMGK